MSAPRYIMPVIVFSCQHCDEQKFQTLSCVHLLHYLSSRKLDIFIRALLRSHPYCRKNYGSSRVHLVVLVIALIYGGGTDRLSDGQTKTNIADDNFFFLGGGGERKRHNHLKTILIAVIGILTIVSIEQPINNRVTTAVDKHKNLSNDVTVNKHLCFFFSWDDAVPCLPLVNEECHLLHHIIRHVTNQEDHHNNYHSSRHTFPNAIYIGT